MPKFATTLLTSSLFSLSSLFGCTPKPLTPDEEESSPPDQTTVYALADGEDWSSF